MHKLGAQRSAESVRALMGNRSLLVRSNRPTHGASDLDPSSLVYIRLTATELADTAGAPLPCPPLPQLPGGQRRPRPAG